MDKTISWHDLSQNSLVVLRDKERNIDIDLKIALWDKEKVILECADFIYTIVITKDTWEDGRVIFKEKSKTI
ncbi:hypothetical protein CD30_08980 [Ureibacillus massiliensis 4400831 = CIP 108448 = CCUG 49529]|uniref:Uncharacterized protein n=1 Tax=Ureibacillus massiliensis 4400831 = CIP 108448 = CCUG 49529 TaxID=1211035 RepID=A0A0A3J569_9BACL|nr:hypothetical protein [Ureibacillus massiliensis]KGR90840.1 hypothetical protein CD30_08980 [Ureibacillus massiliensis 4400831 = CIP 108448 = CCUG 49529]